MAGNPLELTFSPLHPQELPKIYQILRKAFGHQKWWPGDTPFEIMVGAILTQSTSWRNVEKAILNLKAAQKLSPKKIHKMSERELAELIRPAGYFNVKANRLKNFVSFFCKEYDGKISRMKAEKGKVLRQKLLAVKGIGPETADSILLYALDKPFFVIDAYTKRIFERHLLQMHGSNKARGYHDWQDIFKAHLPSRRALFNDYHAQIVALAKNFCKASRPLCSICPLSSYAIKA